MHQNIAGLLSKSDNLTVCLQELIERNIKIDVLCLTEHFVMEGYESHINVPNYYLAACYSRKESKRGGACILVEKGHQCREITKITQMSTTGVLECCAVELIKQKTIIVCVYRVPKINNFSLCMDKLDILMCSILKNGYKNVIIAGDFNVNVLLKNKQTTDFECLLLNYNLHLALRQATRLKSQTCIDNFAHNLRTCKATVLELALSDHTAQILKCPVESVCSIDRWRTIKRDYNADNINKFKSYIKSLSFKDVYESSDPNEAYSAFFEIYNFLYEQCFPKTIVYISVKKKQTWISRGVKLCSRKKRTLLWKYRSNPTIQNKIYFKKYSKLFKTIINKTKCAQNTYKIKTSKNKSKTTWQLINNKKFNLPKHNINKIRNGNKYITSPNGIATLFNNYFVDKIQPSSSQSGRVNKHIVSRKDSMFMLPSMPQDIQKIINSLKNTNSVGYDGFSTKIIKEVSSDICGPLSHIINLCITEGVFPDALKKSVVKPLFKKQDKELVEFYRPISLIPIFSKIIEKYIYKELNTYLEKNKILCDEQKGFRAKKTINMAIYDFLYKIMLNIDKRNPVCAIFCDMTQAFDYVQHDTLLSKLECYGIRGNIHNLIKSYLQNRKQVTAISRINSETKFEEISVSEERQVVYGVPQGSVLGPLLFTIYINDFPKCIEHVMTLFADDSTITIPCNKEDEFNQDIYNTLNNSIEWLENNNLKINLNKTVITYFGQRINIENNNDIKYKNNKIESVASTKFLGLIIDQNLNWKSHLENLAKKLSNSAFALYSLSQTVNAETLLIAYYGIAESILRYGLIFWGNSTDWETIFRAQKRCLRSMFKLKVTDSCKPYFEQYKILTLPSLYILEVVMFVKCNPHLFPRLEDVAHRNRRDNSKLCLHPCKTALMRRSIFCMAPIVYNKLPKIWRELNTEALKRRLKLFLVQRAYYNIKEFLDEKLLDFK